MSEIKEFKLRPAIEASEKYKMTDAELVTGKNRTNPTDAYKNRHMTKVAAVNVLPSVDSLVSDAMSIISSELAFYRAKTKRGISLDMKEARIVRDYVDALVKLSKEARECSRQEDLSKLSNEELLQLAVELVKNNPTEAA